MTNGSTLLTVTDLGYRVGSQHVFSGLGFKIQSGEYVGLIGENGTGKTTLLRVLMGLLPNKSGSIVWFDKNESIKVRPKIGYVPQYTSDYENFPATVKELITFSGETSQEYRELLEQYLGVKALQTQLFTSLSGGQRQLVYIYRALVNQPQMLFLDEPTSALDVSHQQDFYKLLKVLQQDYHMSIVFVTHDIESIAHDTDRILCLRRSHVEEISHTEIATKEIEKKLQHIHR